MVRRLQAGSFTYGRDDTCSPFLSDKLTKCSNSNYEFGHADRMVKTEDAAPAEGGGLGMLRLQLRWSCAVRPTDVLY